MTIGIAQFPGSNCDHDCLKAMQRRSVSAQFLWHDTAVIPGDVRGIILPGGFSYGDFLRAGALAKHSPIMRAIASRPDLSVIGICNGFQILTESGLLPGALLRNASGHFICREVAIKWKEVALVLPIAHGDGRFHHSHPQTLDVIATYSGENPNGSVSGIAGVRFGKTMGLMPHPERGDGSVIWEEFLARAYD